MASLNITVSGTAPPVQSVELPQHRSNWPDAAVASFLDVLGELNAWTRECGEPSGGNAWIAETAVRQAW